MNNNVYWSTAIFEDIETNNNSIKTLCDEVVNSLSSFNCLRDCGLFSSGLDSIQTMAESIKESVQSLSTMVKAHDESIIEGENKLSNNFDSLALFSGEIVDIVVDSASGLMSAGMGALSGFFINALNQYQIDDENVKVAEERYYNMKEKQVDTMTREPATTPSQEVTQDTSKLGIENDEEVHLKFSDDGENVKAAEERYYNMKEKQVDAMTREPATTPSNNTNLENTNNHSNNSTNNGINNSNNYQQPNKAESINTPNNNIGSSNNYSNSNNYIDNNYQQPNKAESINTPSNNIGSSNNYSNSNNYIDNSYQQPNKAESINTPSNNIGSSNNYSNSNNYIDNNYQQPNKAESINTPSSNIGSSNNYSNSNNYIDNNYQQPNKTESINIPNNNIDSNNTSHLKDIGIIAGLGAAGLAAMGIGKAVKNNKEKDNFDE